MAKKPTPKGKGIGAATGAQLGMQGSNTQTPNVNTNFGANLRKTTGMGVWKPTAVLHPPKKK